MSYFNLIPSELNEIILSYVAPIDLEKLIKLFTINANWGTVYYYRYGTYKKMNNYSDYKEKGLSYLKNILKLDHTLRVFMNTKILNWTRKWVRVIPNQIEFLTNLVELNLSANELKEIPSQIYNLVNLQSLNLSNNKIYKIPSQITNLHNLRYLYLSENQIKEIPKEIGDMVNLRALYVGRNQVKEIPPYLQHMKGKGKIIF